MLIFEACTYNLLKIGFVNLLLFNMTRSIGEFDLGILGTVIEFLTKYEETY